MTKKQAITKARKMRSQGKDCKVLLVRGITTCAVRKEIVPYYYYTVSTEA